MPTQIMEHTTEIISDAATAFAWHEREGALFRLSPPWENISLVSRDGGIEAGAKCHIDLNLGFMTIPWYAEHLTYEKNSFFKDRQAKGPFALWEHSHYFSENKGVTTIKDHVEYRLPLSFISQPAAGSFVRRKLQKMFRYRESVCKNDIEFFNEYKPRPKTIIISGSSGVLGTSLIPFLQTQGHRVIRLIRDKSKLCIGDVCWNPGAGIIDESLFQDADAVIHLTGEPIGEGKWTEMKKREIIDSRVRSTDLLTETLSKMQKPPKTFICASAIGFYGDSKDELMTENSRSGHNFIARVCKRWEESAKPAEAKGIRTVFLRIGVVLTPSGGALKRMALPFSLGLGPAFGSGKQFLSFISMDDALYSIAHILEKDDIRGPVNLTSPHALTNKEFSDRLAGFFKKPRFVRIPSYAIEKIYGQMGREVLLAGSNVYPEKLLRTGFRFRYPVLEDILSHQLGHL